MKLFWEKNEINFFDKISYFVAENELFCPTKPWMYGKKITPLRKRTPFRC